MRPQLFSKCNLLVMFRSLLQKESPDAGASNISKKIKQPLQFHLEDSFNRQKLPVFVLCSKDLEFSSKQNEIKFSSEIGFLVMHAADQFKIFPIM